MASSPPAPPLYTLPCDVPRLEARLSTVASASHPAEHCVDGLVRTYCSSNALTGQWLSIRVPPSTLADEIIPLTKGIGYVACHVAGVTVLLVGFKVAVPAQRRF